MKKDFVFPCGNSIWDLNPLNAKIGNDFMDNLITTGYVVGERVGYYALNPRIVKAFVPASKVASEIGERPTGYNKKYTIGLGIDYTWDNWNEEEALVIAHKILDSFIEEKIHIVINSENALLSIYRKMKNSKIVQHIGENYRVIRKE